MTSITRVPLDNSVGAMRYYISEVEKAVAANDRAAFKATMADIARSAICSMQWADDVNTPMTDDSEVSHG